MKERSRVCRKAFHYIGSDTRSQAGGRQSAKGPLIDTSPQLVLDTNVVLDWLYFRDARCAGLGEAIALGHVRWIASAQMRAELQHVLEQGLRANRPVNVASILQLWDRHATMVDATEQPAARALRCTDTDDQKFIDLAVQVRAAALLSADRAVLKLARRAAAQGLRILRVPDWQAPSVMDPAPRPIERPGVA